MLTYCKLKSISPKCGLKSTLRKTISRTKGYYFILCQIGEFKG